ncbi:helix-turn-helix transcriptional regulator [Myxococcus xanthus]|uniref:helix-turn-helix transcriptional regulator n=1 Tax=Myxococcus xanthus TaxID=34 RepID=UPI00112C394B|nr:WYL domain-containing protein [Myxococcus xanthus]QDE84644.1 transcriptional regulator [Myxococcus xanthus]QDE98808.1 transcriptional regulator [Myxococcus xanthus]
MARVDRVMRLLDFLRGRDGTTVAEIAEALDVSARTVHRDLATLREQGLPLSSDTGPGGGVRLERDRGVAAVHLSQEEVVALWLAANLSATGSTLPWGSAARSGLQKLFASVPKERARGMRELCRRVVVGRPASVRVLADVGTPPEELLAVFERAFREQVCLSFEYRDRHGKATRRIVEPHGLLVESPVWYVLARDVEKAAARMFRMDRIRRARLVPDRPFTPDMEGLRAQAEAQRADGARASS